MGLMVQVTQSAFEDKPMVVGIGMQKAGTTWLYRFLQQHPQVWMSPIKELHYFNEIYRPGMTDKRWRDVFIRSLQQQSAALAKTFTERRLYGIEAMTDRLWMETDPRRYMHFFRRRVPAGAAVFGEITPAYSLLPVEGFRDLRAQHRDMRIILLLRDPVDRVYSQLRMRERNGGPHAADVFMESLHEPLVHERSRYDFTLQRLLAVFSPETVHVEFYERLFTPEAVAGICRFLGVEPRPAEFDERVNSSAPGAPLTEAQIDAGRAVFDPVYAFCREMFGDRLPAEWRV